MLSRSSFKMLALLGSLLFLVACGGDDGDDSVLGECPPDSAAQQTRGQTVLADNCQGCHASTVTGTDRGSAPVGVDFDVDSVVSSRAEAIYEKVLGTFPTGTIMPPPPDYSALNDSDTEDLRVYLACLGQ